MRKDLIRRFWDGQSHSLHRESGSQFYAKKASEHISLLDEKEKLYPAIDIGCGAGELIAQLIGKLDIRVACDISISMLEEARKRIGDSDIRLLQINDLEPFLISSDEAMWMTTGAINQYLNANDLYRIVDVFQKNSQARLFILFDCVDPYRYFLLRTETSYLPPIGTQKLSALSVLRIVARLLWRCWLHLYRSVKIICSGSCVYLSKASMGYGFKTFIWHKWCSELGLSCEIVSSRYYEYRYHVIIRKSCTRPRGTSSL